MIWFGSARTAISESSTSYGLSKIPVCFIIVSLAFLDRIAHTPFIACLSPLVTQLASLVEKSTSARVRVHAFYTRATSTPFDSMILPRGITLLPGRPNLNKLLHGSVIDTMSAGGTIGFFVGVCGPVTLANTMARVVNGFDARMRADVGGVEFHEETFGW